MKLRLVVSKPRSSLRQHRARQTNSQCQLNEHSACHCESSPMPLDVLCRTCDLPIEIPAISQLVKDILSQRTVAVHGLRS